MDLLFSSGSSKTGRTGAADGQDLIKESNTAGFRADVIEASMKAVVLVDFWAPWCGPCKQLGPALEKVVREAKGAARLVKINVDANQQLAAQLRVQSVPMVYAFKDGRPVDAFTGALPESELRAFLKALIGPVGPNIDEIVTEARTLLTDGDATTAAGLFQQVLQAEPEHPAALAGLLRCLIAVGESAQAEEMIASLPPELARHSELTAVATALELARRASEIGETEGLLRQVEANPDDHQARFDLALACFAENQPEAAIDALLELFRRDRTWNDGAARAELVKLFEALGSAHPAVSAGRRRLSSLMFS
ncbi:thioredoxin family protein [Magnetospirillum molischianum]|uniref:Putative thioredoxin n=1 Tax=Magnetospirillum molischianum DSM 120 TaxID=1150626 RepID=H8FTB8_MAGML|nr:co-chaperone YbbN [Magnetospirillum molischianum]CCG41606.1 putative thioredoxin [Magnetospirillum molischianum DSM 120]